jgi:hypothetical protein
MQQENMSKRIEDRQVSVIVQGPIVGGEDESQPELSTRRCLQGIRRLLPNSEIILSTWKGTNTNHLPCDILIENDDPGCWIRKHGYRNNVNRQIVSTREGLRMASRPYAVKLRSDCELVHAGFLSGFYCSEPRSAQLQLFNERVVACEMFFRNPAHVPLLFHISDLFMFGLRDDLFDL